jgi:hypothetical protein
MKNDLAGGARKAKSYWYVDGISELVFGLAILAGATYYYLAAQANPNSDLLSGSAPMLVVVVGYLLATSGIEFAKARLTHPRTGYVKYRQPVGIELYLRGGAAFAVGLAIARSAVLYKSHLDPRLLPTLAGGLVGLSLLVLGIRVSLIRFYVLAFFVAGLGVCISYLGLQGIQATALFLGGIGICLVASGLLTLWKYLRANPGNEAETL